MQGPNRRGASRRSYVPFQTGPSNIYATSTIVASQALAAQLTPPGLSDTADASESITSILAILLATTASATSTIVHRADMSLALASTGAAYESLELGFALALSASATAAESLSLKEGAALVDTLVATGQVTSTLAGIQAVAVALTLSDLIASGYAIDLADTAAATETVASLFSANLALVASAAAEESIADVLGVAISLTDSAAMAASLSANATLAEALEAGASGVVSLSLGATDYVALIANTDTRALSRYPSFAFNSLAILGNAVFAASDTGLYELTGSDDAGTEIQAKVQTGLTDFGSDQLKRFESAALGYTSDGALVLKVSASQAGAAKEKWYQLSAQTADYPREGVVKLAKGTKARYWQFELENIDGADFDLSSVRLYPIMLTRRR